MAYEVEQREEDVMQHETGAIQKQINEAKAILRRCEIALRVEQKANTTRLREGKAKAFTLFKQGASIRAVTDALELPTGTVRSWRTQWGRLRESAVPISESAPVGCTRRKYSRGMRGFIPLHTWFIPLSQMIANTTVKQYEG